MDPLLARSTIPASPSWPASMECSADETGRAGGHTVKVLHEAKLHSAAHGLAASQLERRNLSVLCPGRM
jgi:hypothetical protein